MDTETESDVTMPRSNRRYNPYKFTIRVTNSQTGAVFTHRSVTRHEAEWIDLDPNLTVEYLKH
jgi:hypothetical protein